MSVRRYAVPVPDGAGDRPVVYAQDGSPGAHPACRRDLPDTA
ncbi:MAG: hypothetical protein AB1941_04900 [Gemmatimonadota bacterium]